MTKIFSVCVFMVVAVAVCSPQEATRGNWLLASCRLAIKQMDDPHFAEDHYESYRDGYCRGLIVGVGYASPKACQGENVTNGQQFRVVLKYLEDHPEELDQEGYVLVEKALAKAFPCQK